MRQRGEQFKQLGLFNAEPYSARMDYSPDVWTQRADVQWHSSADHPQMPEQRQEWGGKHGRSAPVPLRDLPDADPMWGSSTHHPLGIHNGTAKAAAEVNDLTTHKRFFHPVRHEGSYALPAEEHMANDGDRRSPTLWDDEHANGEAPESTEAVRSGKHVPYANTFEDPGSVSYRSPRENLKTWRQDVMSDANAPRRYRDLASHGYDLTYQSVPTMHDEFGGKDGDVPPMHHYLNQMFYQSPTDGGERVRGPYDPHDIDADVKDIERQVKRGLPFNRAEGSPMAVSKWSGEIDLVPTWATKEKGEQ